MYSSLYILSSPDYLPNRYRLPFFIGCGLFGRLFIGNGVVKISLYDIPSLFGLFKVPWGFDAHFPAIQTILLRQAAGFG